jgi:hypothetical protein
MKNLENYGVQELGAKEKISVDGGFFAPWIVALMGPPGMGIDMIADYIDRKYQQGAACN